MTGSVRSQIIEKIITRLSAIGNVVLVIEQAEQADHAVGEAIGGGGYVIELVCEDDVPDDGAEAISLEAWRFDVHCVIYLPPKLPDDRRPSDVAADVASDIYLSYTSEADQDGKWDGLALKTDSLGGGGAFVVPETGWRGSYAAFRVHYRHHRGQPGAAA